MCRSTFLAACVLLTSAAIVVTTSSSARALDCNGRLVVVGDLIARVEARCGAPTSHIQRMEARSVYGRRVTGRGSIGEAATVTVQIDVYVYDFGPSRLMQELTFENGVLVRTRTLRQGERSAPVLRAPAR